METGLPLTGKEEGGLPRGGDSLSPLHACGAIRPEANYRGPANKDVDYPSADPTEGTCYQGGCS